MSDFSKCFWQARKEHKEQFEYKGKLYHTKTKEEISLIKNKFQNVIVTEYNKPTKPIPKPEINKTQQKETSKIQQQNIFDGVHWKETEEETKIWPPDKSLRYAAYYKLAFDMAEVIIAKKFGSSKLNLFSLLGKFASKNNKLKSVLDVLNIFIVKYAGVLLKEAHILIRKII